MDHPGHDPFGHLGYTEHRTAVIVKFDDVPVLDAARFSIRRIKAYGLPVIAVFENTVGRNIVQPESMLIIMGMERIPGMR